MTDRLAELQDAVEAFVAAATAKLALNREKYPIEKAKGRATKHTDLD